MVDICNGWNHGGIDCMYNGWIPGNKGGLDESGKFDTNGLKIGLIYRPVRLSCQAEMNSNVCHILS